MSLELAKICEPLGVRIVANDRYRHDAETCAVATLENILVSYGEAHLTLVLRSIVETNGNARELTAPMIWAISDLINAHPTWPMSTAWLEALDRLDLAAIREIAKENRRGAKLRPALATMLFLHLRQAFEPAT
jgi:hypothetical protein